MFRIRRHTCKVVLATSLVWCFVIFFLLVTVFDRGNSGGDSGNRLIPLGSGSGKHEALHYAHRFEPGRDTGRFRRWTPVQTVIIDQGQPGALGKPVHIPKSREEEKKEKFRINQFNLLASEMISLNRSLTDVRLPA